MEFLGIGPAELVAILIIIFVIFGPGDMVKMGATLGRSLRRLRQSEAWRAMQQATRELRSLPDNLARQAGIEDFEETAKDLKEGLDAPRKAVRELDRSFVAWTRQGEAPTDEPFKEEPPKKPEAPKKDKAKES
jgi:Sec-independent protein translocase protein TatA